MMSIKLSEAKHSYADKKRVDRAIMPGRAYFVILATTVILLLSFTVAFFAVFAKTGGGYLSDEEDYSQNGGEASPNSNNSGNSNNSNNSNNSGNSNSGAIGSGLSIGGNAPSKTTPKRTSYISKTSSGVVNLTDQILSNNVILIDLDNYTSIVEKSADTKIYPASMTKVMSLLVACENLKSLKTTLTVTQDTVDYMAKMGGSGVGLKVGEELDTQDLLYLTAYQSDTVAVLMLAKHIAGSEAKFVDLMNAKARSLGLTRTTRFANCTGLYDDNNYTTCREMAAIFAYALENPLCRELLTSYKAYSVNGKYTLYSTWYSGRFDDNPRLNTVTVKGGKTGYIDESGFCLVSYAESRSSGKEYIQVIVGQPQGSGLREDLSVKDIKYVYNNYAN